MAAGSATVAREGEATEAATVATAREAAGLTAAGSATAVAEEEVTEVATAAAGSMEVVSQPLWG